MNHTLLLAFIAPIACLTAACSSTPGQPEPDAGAPDAADQDAAPDAADQDAAPDAADDAGDAGEGDAGIPPGDAGVTPCPTSGGKGIQAPGVSCFTVTPAETGAAASGENATVPSYALFPDSNPRGELLIFLNGSGGSPAGGIASPTQSFYTAATSLGYAVLAVSYYSKAPVKKLCLNADPSLEDACYFPTRQAIILGVAPPGANAAVAQEMTVDQGIAGRVALALAWLAKGDPAHDWGSFLTAGSGGPETRIAWSKVAVTGHSQGGGHAAAMGKLFGVARVVQLSSVCDDRSGGAASWTKGTTGTWASDPTQFHGLDAPTVFTGTTPTGGDTTCPAHAANWANLGMVAAHRHDDGATCGNTGDAHGDSISCVQNYATWTAMLQ